MGTPARFAVESEQTRLQAALARLDPASRAVLVLREYARLPVEEVAEASGLHPEQVFATLAQVTPRVREAAGLQPGNPSAPALARLAMDVPCADLRPELEPLLAAGFARERRRGRLITGSVLGLLGLLFAAGLWLLFGNGIESNEQSGPAAGANAAPTAAIEPEAAFAAVEPAGAAALAPPADLPDQLLLARTRDAGSATLLLNAGGAGSPRPLPYSGEGEVLEAGMPVVAPDGRMVVGLFYDIIGDELTAVAAGFDPELTRMLWRVPLRSAPYTPDGFRSPPFLLSAAIDEARVYVAVHHWDTSLPVEIVVIDPATAEIDWIQTDLPGFIAHDVRLYAPVESGRVYTFAITREEPPEIGTLQLNLLGYDVATHRRVYSRLLIDMVDSRVFFLYGSRYAPDGHTLYGLSYTSARAALAVHFFDLETGVLLAPVTIPFVSLANPLPVQSVASHDGEHLYVFSPLNREVAVVDLRERRLLGVIPLDVGVPGDLVYVPQTQMALSPDGRTLYAIGTTSGAESPRLSGVWVIDTAGWTVTAHWAQEVAGGALTLDGAGRYLYLQEQEVRGLGTVHVLDADSGAEIGVVEASESRPVTTLAAQYRALYGLSPSIAGNVPTDPAAGAPLAGIAVSVAPQRLAYDGRAVIDLRFVHPISGEPVREGERGARFALPGSVRVVFTPNGGGAPVILELGPAEFGRYQGVVSLPEPDGWQVTITVQWAADQRTVRLLRRLDVTPPPSRAAPGSGSTMSM